MQATKHRRIKNVPGPMDVDEIAARGQYKIKGQDHDEGKDKDKGKSKHGGMGRHKGYQHKGTQEPSNDDCACHVAEIVSLTFNRNLKYRSASFK